MSVLLKRAASSALRSVRYRSQDKCGKGNVSAPLPKRIQKLKNHQRKFQEDNGIPVYLKGGTMDKVLFNACVIGSLVGLAMGIHTFVTLALQP